MFGTLTGNEPVKQSLQRLIQNGRVPNALLFAGPEGVGKKRFAFELARAFVCQSPSGIEGCGECHACRRVDTFVIPEPTDKNKDDFKKVFFGEHVDVGKIVAYKRTILVDAIRELEKAAYFRPYEAKARFFVIDDADKMNDEASNALLKTLEEPASTSHIILISSRPDTLLQTIHSRCQTIRFAPVAVDLIERFLLDSTQLPNTDARIAARMSGGSIGRAISTDIEKLLERRAAMFDVFENAASISDRALLLQSSEQLNDAKNKDDFENNLYLLETLIRDAWLLKNGAEQTALMNIDLADDLARLGENASSATFSSWLGEIEQLRETLAVNINRKIASDALFMSMAGR